MTHAAPRRLTWWYGATALGGLAFGVVAERRPFGDAVLAHPLVILFALIGGALIALRVALARPVPEVLPERALVVGCVVAAGAFLIGNWFAVHLAAIR